MDQVKIYLAILKKHHFWLVSSLAALVGVICWWMGSSTLAQQYSANKSTVDGKYKSITGLSGELPNGSFATVVNTLHDTAKEKVFAEWQKQYEQQQKLFVWPDVMGVKDIPKLQEGGKPLESDVRQRYKQLVFPNELERIFTVANIRRRAMRTSESRESTRPIAGTGAQPAAAAPIEDAPEEPQEEDGLVVWDAGHRATLLARYDFVHKEGLDVTEVNLRTAQEDMWILEQLAKIIARTNEGATDEAALAVKRIVAMDVAQWAVEDSQRNQPTLRLPKPTAAPAAAAAAAPAAAPAGEEGAAAAAATPDAQDKENAELLDGRYLTDSNQPAGADEISFSEFKRIFVRMKLDVDQRKLNDLLVNCANSELPLDVIRVQVDLPLLSKEKATSNVTQPQGSGSTSEIIAGPYDVPVEICGIIQIYNPPVVDKLAQGTGDPTKRSLEMPTGRVKPPRVVSRQTGPKP